MEIYLIKAQELNLYKIGYSKNSINRLKQLQTGSPYQLELVHVYTSKKFPFKVEKIMHRSMSLYKKDESLIHLKGEWFDLKKIDIENFIHNCEKAESNLIFLHESGNPFIK